MWFLEMPTNVDLDWYSGKMLKGLKDRISQKQVYANVLLNNGRDNYLRLLLIAPPKHHYWLNEYLMKRFIGSYNQMELELYVDVKNKKDKDLDKNQKRVKGTYSKVLNELLEVFDYKNQISQSKSKAYELAKRKQVNVCPYCGRQYIFTVIQKDSQGKNDEERIARPEFDHWYSKELFPLLSLNYYNLIPSCHICNSTAKGTTMFSLDTHIHPYIKENNCEFTFRSRIKTNGEYGVDIVNVKNKKLKQTIDSFCLEDIYDYHGELEVKDLMTMKKKYRNQQIDRLMQELHELFPNMIREDLYKMIFSAELKEANDLSRPLSKLKRDILEEIGVL